MPRLPAGLLADGAPLVDVGGEVAAGSQSRNSDVSTGNPRNRGSRPRVSRPPGLRDEDGDVSTSLEPRRPDVTTVELIGGVEALGVGLHPYDDQWPGRYLDHRRRIDGALANRAALIEHIGSTAVPGLAAKPIIDIVVTVDDITAETDYLDALLSAGYELRVREPGHRLVRTPGRDVHVHLYEQDDPAVDDYLLLRDHLRSDPDDRRLYERTKQALIAQRWDDMNDYADAKSDVIRTIKARARAAHPDSDRVETVR